MNVLFFIISGLLFAAGFMLFMASTHESKREQAAGFYCIASGIFAIAGVLA